MEQAALYLRSSKDRHDVSLDAQRRDLIELAKARHLLIVEEFADAVESGKDDQRPGFQALLRRLKSSDRAWTWLLALDTSRIARNQYLAHAVHYEAEKRGIKIAYAKVPETNTIMDIVIRSVMQAFDQLHSLMSREKGLAGMAENVRQGWRAGGRAPIGYQLERIPTGVLRDGAPVAKSKLVRSPDATRIAAYLKARAAGTARHLARKISGVELQDTTAIGVEWNALTYAGHTVWNVNAQRVPGGYHGGRKRRPRSEWLVQYDTHDALISTEEAETILARLEQGRPSTHRHSGIYLLSGLLQTPDGSAWHGSGDGYYRVGKAKRIKREGIESAIVKRVLEDLRCDRFVDELVREARRIAAPPTPDALEPQRRRVRELEALIAKLADLASQIDTPRPFLERIKVAEQEHQKLLEQIAEAEVEQRAADVLRAISAADVRKILASLAEKLEESDRESMKDFLAGLLERVELTLDGQECVIHYRISTGDSLASPRGIARYVGSIELPAEAWLKAA
jgi:site-specific DNA recombinase